MPKHKTEDNYRPTWKATKTYNYLTNSWYDSRMEASHAGTLKLLGGIDWIEQAITFLVPFIQGGSYKPDMVYKMSNRRYKGFGSAWEPMAGRESKGALDGHRNEQTRDFVKSRVDDPNDPFVRWTWDMRDDLGQITYDGIGDWEESAIYTCPECGHTFDAVKTRHWCPYCDNENTTFVTDKANEFFNYYWRKIADEVCRRMDVAYDQGRKLNVSRVANEVIREIMDEIARRFRPETAVYKPAKRDRVREINAEKIKEIVDGAFYIEPTAQEGEEN